jgi:hypothetical protein
MKQVTEFVKARIGAAGFVALLGGAMMGSALSFFIFALRKRLHPLRLFVLGIAVCAGLAWTWRIKIPVERIHIIEYAVLGWFSTRDFLKGHSRVKGAVFAYLFSAAVGILDELFQAILPYRVCDVIDMALNSLGGAYGIALYLLS